MTGSNLRIRHIKAGSFQTRYIKAGHPGLPTLILLHDGAFGATAELSWGRVIPMLEDEFHIIAPDLLGWGGTDKAVFLDRSPYAGRLEHLKDLIDALEIDSAIYAGCSFGGSLVVRGALLEGNSLRMRGGISIAGTGGPYRTAEGLQALGAYKPTLEGAVGLTELLVSDTSGLNDHIRGRLTESLVPGHWEVMAAPRLQSPDFPRERAPDSLFDDLKKLGVPLRLIEATEDALMEPGWSSKMAELSPLISTVLLKSGHLPNVQAPAMVAPLVRRFAAEIETRT